MKSFKHLFLVTLILLISMGIGFGCQNKTTNKDGESGIPAFKLYSEYEANSVAADNKYKGKVIRVTGKIEEIEKSFMDVIHVSLKGGDYIGIIDCGLSDSMSTAALQLTKGQKITVKGKCIGKSYAVISLSECVIE